MQKNTLRKYLLYRQLELYETVDKLKNKLLSNSFTERDTINLEVTEAELKVIKEVIEICNSRHKY